MERQIVLSTREYDALVKKAESAGDRKVLEGKILKATNCVMEIAQGLGQCILKSQKTYCKVEKSWSCKFFNACNYKGKNIVYATSGTHENGHM